MLTTEGIPFTDTSGIPEFWVIVISNYFPNSGFSKTIALERPVVGARFVAFVVTAIRLPSSDIDTLSLASLPGSSNAFLSTRAVVPVCKSRTYTWCSSTGVPGVTSYEVCCCGYEGAVPAIGGKTRAKSATTVSRDPVHAHTY